MIKNSRIEKMIAFVGLALVLSGCAKEAAKEPEKSLVRTVTVASLDNTRSDGEAS